MLARQDAMRCDAVQSDFKHANRSDDQPNTEIAWDFAFRRVPTRRFCGASRRGYVQRTILALPVIHGQFLDRSLIRLPGVDRLPIRYLPGPKGFSYIPSLSVRHVK